MWKRNIAFVFAVLFLQLMKRKAPMKEWVDGWVFVCVCVCVCGVGGGGGVVGLVSLDDKFS